MSSLKTMEKKLIYTIRQELALDILMDKYAEQRIARAISQHELYERLKDHSLTRITAEKEDLTNFHKVTSIHSKRDWYLAKTLL